MSSRPKRRREGGPKRKQRQSQPEPAYPRPAAEPEEAFAHLTADQVQDEVLDYLWEPIFPRGKYCLIEGDEGVGKSLLIARLIADITGGPRIDGGRRRRPGRPVLYLPGEEGLKFDVKPRLRAAGADLALVSFGPDLHGGTRAWRPELPHDLPRLDRFLKQLKPLALILEPIVSYFAADCPWRDDQTAKKVVDPLCWMAEEHRCLFLAARHWKKDASGQGTNRGMGSKVISGNARVVLQLARQDGPGGGFVMGLVKWAAPRCPPARHYDIVPGDGWSVLKIGKPMDVRAEEMGRVTSPGAALKMTQARQILRHKIADGWVASKDLVAACKAEGISDSILYEARAKDKVPWRWKFQGELKYSEWGPPLGGWQKLE